MYNKFNYIAPLNSLQKKTIKMNIVLTFGKFYKQASFIFENSDTYF